MKVTTAPPKQKFPTAEDRRERASRTKIAILTFGSDGSKVHRMDVSRSKDLSQAFDKSQDDHDDIHHARSIVLEDLSKDMIEILGSRFDIDPYFFRHHISDYIWYNNCDP